MGSLRQEMNSSGEQRASPQRERREGISARSNEAELSGTWKWSPLPPVPYSGRSNISSKGKQRGKLRELSSRPKKPDLTIKPPTFRRSNSLGPTYNSPDSGPLRTAIEYPSSSSSLITGMQRNASLPIPEARFSPPDSEAEDYGEVVDTELDAIALNQLQPRLQASMRALKAEKDDHKAIPGHNPSEQLLNIQKQKLTEPVSQTCSLPEGEEAGSKRKRGVASQTYNKAKGKEAEVKEPVSQAYSISEGIEAGSKRKRGVASQTCDEAEGKEAEIKEPVSQACSGSEGIEAGSKRKRGVASQTCDEAEGKEAEIKEPVSQACPVSEGIEAGSKRKCGAALQTCDEAEGKGAEIKRQHIELELARSASEAREADLMRKSMPLSSNPLTEIERAQARTLTMRFQQQQFRSLSSILPQLPPGPVNRRPIVRKKSHASIRAPKPRLAKISGRMGTAGKWIKKMFRKEKSQARDWEVKWEEDAEYHGNDDEDEAEDEYEDEDEDDEDTNADEEDFDDSGVPDKVDPKENRLRDCRFQKTRLRRLTPMVYSPAKPLTIEPLPSEAPLRPSPERPQAPGQPTSRAAMEGYF